jgi:hypothetical protein
VSSVCKKLAPMRECPAAWRTAPDLRRVGRSCAARRALLLGRQNPGCPEVCGVSVGGDSIRPISQPIEVAEVVHGDHLALTNDTRTPTLGALQNEAPTRPHRRLGLLEPTPSVDAQALERGVADDVAHDSGSSRLQRDSVQASVGVAHRPPAEQNPPGPRQGEGPAGSAGGGQGASCCSQRPVLHDGRRGLAPVMNIRSCAGRGFTLEDKQLVGLGHARSVSRAGRRPRAR